ncbi:hypothetical protein ARMGADRAFT_946862, partial [Armillaria gallica]
GILNGYPDVKSKIQKILCEYRQSTIPINVNIGCATMLVIIKDNAPKLLASGFKCSEKFVCHFYDSVMRDI